MAREILEPYLWLLICTSIYQGKSSIFQVRVDIEGMDVMIFWVGGVLLLITTLIVSLSNTLEGEHFFFDPLDISQLI